jgi:hypothetical protein
MFHIWDSQSPAGRLQLETNLLGGLLFGLRFFFDHHTLAADVLDFGVDLTANAQNEPEEIKPNHQDDESSQAAVGNAVTRRIT